MILELYTWTDTKETLLNGLALYGFGSFDEEGNFINHPEVQISHIGVIPKITGYDTEGNPIIEIVDGHHANLRCFGNLTDWFMEGKVQYNEDGSLKSVFERTKVLDIIQGLQFKQTFHNGVPSGYAGPNGVLLIDPSIVVTPYNVWA